MGYLFQPTSDFQVFELDAGIHAGTGVITRHGCSVIGAGRDSTILRLDAYLGSTGGFVFPYPPQTGDGKAVRNFTLKHLTIDGNQLVGLVDGLLASQFAGPGGSRDSVLAIEDVRITGLTTSSTAAIILQEGHADIRQLVIECDCQAIISSGATKGDGIVIEDLLVRGGRGGLIVANDSQASTFDINRMTFDSAYWQGPSGESISVTAIGDTYVNVVANVVANRQQNDNIRIWKRIGTAPAPDGAFIITHAARIYDRIEDANGIWGQVERIMPSGWAYVPRWHRSNSWIPAPAPTNTVNILRATMGQVFDWSLDGKTISLQLLGSIPPLPHWRTVTGQLAPTLAVSDVFRADIIRSTLDRDFGGLHWTSGVVRSRIRNSKFIGCGSDCVTDRGTGNLMENVSVTMGDDEGFTIDSDGLMMCGCSATLSGNDGIAIQPGVTGLVIMDSNASRNGTQRNGETISGFGIYSYSDDYRLDRVTGVGNFISFMGGESPSGDVAPRDCIWPSTYLIPPPPVVYPSALQAASAGEYQAALRASSSNPTMDALPTYLWQCDTAGNGDDQDLVAGKIFTSTGGDAVRVASTFANQVVDRALHTVQGSTNWWKVNDVTTGNVTAGQSFATIRIVKYTVGMPAFTTFGWSKSDSAHGWGVYCLTSGAVGGWIIDGVHFANPINAQNHLDEAYHVEIFGRSASNASVYVSTDLGDSSVSSALVNLTLSNNIAAGLGYSAAGPNFSGNGQDVTSIAFFYDDAAEAVLAARVAIAATLLSV